MWKYFEIGWAGNTGERRRIECLMSPSGSGKWSFRGILRPGARCPEDPNKRAGRDNIPAGLVDLIILRNSG